MNPADEHQASTDAALARIDTEARKAAAQLKTDSISALHRARLRRFQAACEAASRVLRRKRREMHRPN